MKQRDLIVTIITVLLTVGAQIAASQGIKINVPAMCPEAE